MHSLTFALWVNRGLWTRFSHDSWEWCLWAFVLRHPVGARALCSARKRGIHGNCAWCTFNTKESSRSKVTRLVIHVKHMQLDTHTFVFVGILHITHVHVHVHVPNYRVPFWCILLSQPFTCQKRFAVLTHLTRLDVHLHPSCKIQAKMLIRNVSKYCVGVMSRRQFEWLLFSLWTLPLFVCWCSLQCKRTA